VFFDQKLDQVILKKMGVESRHADLTPWYSMMARFSDRKGKVRIGIVGKYMELHESYKSVYEALFHGGLECTVEVELIKIDSARLEEAGQVEQVLGGTAAVDGILVPGGFGQRGINGMVKAAAWARTSRIPYLGICLGMQIMVIDWARNVLGWEDADSSEFNQDTRHPVVSLLEDQVDVKNYGGTMRLGKYLSQIEPGTRLFAAYGERNISERHRHRYEFSNKYRKEMTESGLRIAAFYDNEALVESVEWPDHPWGVGVQFHPEFKSKPTAASPLFRDFIAAVRNNQAARG
jgi:CTP synthase